MIVGLRDTFSGCDFFSILILCLAKLYQQDERPSLVFCDAEVRDTTGTSEDR